MRVVQVLGGNEDGGLEKHVVELSLELTKNGIEVWVIANDIYKELFAQTAVHFSSLDLTKSRNNIFTLYTLYKKILHLKPDIIHAQASKATAMVSKIKPFLKTKCIATIHSMKKNVSYFEKMDWVIAVSKRVKAQIKNPNTSCIYNGIKFDKIIKADLHVMYTIEKNLPILCSVGRVVKAKGFDKLINSIAQLQNKAHLIIVGDGEDMKELQELTKKLGLENSITFTGKLPEKETKQLIHSSCLMVISSVKEGFAYVFAESLLLHTPVISTDVADIKIFLPKECITSYADLSCTIDNFLENYDDRLTGYSSYFKKAEETFSVENMTHNTINTYKSILKGKT